jgi:hypothetical protein
MSSILNGTLSDSPPRGRRPYNKKKKTVVKKDEETIKKEEAITAMLKQQEEEYNMRKLLDDHDNPSSLTSEYTRTIHFQSNCRNTEKTHVRHIKPDTYYDCSLCHCFHLIREIG